MIEVEKGEGFTDKIKCDNIEIEVNTTRMSEEVKHIARILNRLEEADKIVDDINRSIEVK